MRLLFLHIIGVFLCAVGNVHFTYGQSNPNIQVKEIAHLDKMLGERVSAVAQDSEGFIWIATVDGLNRYDGNNFNAFSRSNSDLNYEEVLANSLMEDDEGYLWLQYTKNIEFIHHQTFNVLTFEERFKSSPFSKTDIVNVLPDANTKTLLIFLVSGDAFLFKNNEFQALPFLKNKRILQFKNDKIWTIASANSISILSIEGNVTKTINFDRQVENITAFEEDGFYFWEYDGQQLIFNLYKNNQLIRTISTPFTIENTDNPFGSGLSINLFNFRYYPPMDCFIINDLSSSENGKTIYFLFANGTLQKLPIKDKQSLSLIDKNGVFWISGTDKLYLLDILPNRFQHYEGADNARGIWANKDKVFVASSSAYDMRYEVNGFSYGSIYQELYMMAKDKDIMWGGDKGKFGTFDLETGKMTPKIPIKKYLDGNIWACLKDKSGNWWMSHDNTNEKTHLCFYNTQTGDSLDVYNSYNEFEGLKDALIIQLLEDGQYIWAASNKGLILIDKQKGVVGHYWKEAKDGFRLPFNNIHFLHKDKEGVYWAATNYDGLVQFRLNENRKVSNFQQYTSEQYLSSDVLYYIVEDEFERLWISSLTGISCFDKKTEQVQIFTDKEGLPFNEFNRTSGFQAIDNRIYLGGVKGAVGFSPSDFDTVTYQVPLMLSAVNYTVGSEDEIEDKTAEIWALQEIIQHPNTRSITIEVALADYFHSSDANYFYKIEGFHKDFRLMKGNEVQLSSLPYGSYRIIFKGQAADKRFSTSEINLPLTVIRPFYLRWWFILLVIAAVISLFRWYYNWRVAQLKKRQVELEAIVAQRTEQIRKDKAIIEQDKAIIEQQAEELKALDKLKDRFFANISHELRTPLTLILGPLGSLLKDNSQLSNKQFTYLSVIKRHTNYLMKRINEIMELNRLEVNKGQIDLQPVKLYDFLKVTISNFESIAPQKQITFSFDYKMKKTTQALIDKDKFEHIIYNYLSNAFKYTPKGGAVKVIVKEVDNQIQLAVQDTGVGIPSTDIPNLFERFYQAENAQKVGSSGIGLALCKEIAQLLNGRVWAESEVGEGSTFYFTVPYSEFIGIVENEEKEVVEEGNLRGFENLGLGKKEYTILITEDNPELRDYIQAVLSEYYNVITAENGKEALDLLPTANCQLIISDIMMPVMDGLELLDNIKKSDDYRHIPMIMLTARQSMEAKLSALQLGVDDYITKPFNEEELLIRIKNLLRNQAERLSFVQDDENIGNEVSDTLKVSDTDQEWLKEVEALVESHLTDNQFTVVACADKLFLSKRQFQRRIKKCTGLNFTSYVRLARLRKARQLLENGEATTVTAVAQEVGFDTPAYFSKLFYQEFGKKPVDYL